MRTSTGSTRGAAASQPHQCFYPCSSLSPTQYFRLCVAGGQCRRVLGAPHGATQQLGQPHSSLSLTQCVHLCGRWLMRTSTGSTSWRSTATGSTAPCNLLALDALASLMWPRLWWNSGGASSRQPTRSLRLPRPQAQPAVTAAMGVRLRAMAVGRGRRRRGALCTHRRRGVCSKELLGDNNGVVHEQWLGHGDDTGGGHCARLRVWRCKSHGGNKRGT
jgi:hypothetical protein